MNYKIFSSCLSILLSIFFIAKNSLDFSPIRFHCNNYILNSYLYIFLAISIVFATMFSMDNINIDPSVLFSGSSKFLLLLLSLVLLFFVITIKPYHFFTIHLLYFLLIILLSVFIYPIFKYNKDLFYSSGATTLSILILLSFVAFQYPDIIKDSWGFNLFIILIGLIILTIIHKILKNYNIIKSNKYNKIFSYVSVIIFSFYMLYDTKNLIKNSKLCGVKLEPDYINQSLDIILNSVNIFTGITNLKE